MKQFRNTPYFITPDGNIYRNNKLKKLTKRPDGYLVANFTINSIGKTYLVHRLVAECYIPNPDNKPEVNHWDGDKTNNNVDNLVWSTRSENIIHRGEILKINNGQYDVEIIQKILDEYIPRNKNYSQRALSKKYGMSQANISDIVNRKIWKIIQ